MLLAKIHRATVTEADLHYEGSCGIDEDLSACTLNTELDWWNLSAPPHHLVIGVENDKSSSLLGQSSLKSSGWAARNDESLHKSSSSLLGMNNCHVRARIGNGIELEMRKNGTTWIVVSHAVLRWMPLPSLATSLLRFLSGKHITWSYWTMMEREDCGWS